MDRSSSSTMDINKLAATSLISLQRNPTPNTEMETRTGSTAPGGLNHPHLPPGFRFHPTDEELVVHYLKRKAASAPLPVSIITEIDLYKHDPWELPAKASFGENEWYFFSPRDRKYPNGARPNRAATSGYWKATGTDKPIRAGNKVVGVKKALVFYGGKPLKGIKTNWIMHEYRLADCPGGSSNSGSKVGGIQDGGIEREGGDRRKKVSLRLDDWVLCRIYQKNATQRPADQDTHSDPAVFPTIPPPRTATTAATFLPFTNTNSDVQKSSTYSAMLAHDEAFYDGLFASTAPFGARQPELSLVLPDCSRTLSLPLYQSRAAVDGGERDEEACGQVGGYAHHPVMRTYQVAGVNWNA